MSICRRARESPEEPRRTQEVLGELRRAQESPGELRNAQESPAEPRRAHESLGVLGRAQERSGRAQVSHVLCWSGEPRRAMPFCLYAGCHFCLKTQRKHIVFICRMQFRLYAGCHVCFKKAVKVYRDDMPDAIMFICRMSFLRTQMQ